MRPGNRENPAQNERGEVLHTNESRPLPHLILIEQPTDVDIDVDVDVDTRTVDVPGGSCGCTLPVVVWSVGFSGPELKVYRAGSATKKKRNRNQLAIALFINFRLSRLRNS